MRSKDRLDELRHLAQQAGVYHDTVLAEPRAPLSKDIDDLLREVEPLRAWILDVERNTQLIRRLHADPTYTSNRQLQEQLDALATASHALGLKACGALRQLAARARCGAASGAASRMAHLQFAATRRLCDAALARHEHALQALRDQQHRLLHEQIKLTNLTISEEECEHLLESNNIALFVDNLHAETAEARLALRDAEARRDELARVERSLQSVRDLFLQLAHLVAAQVRHPAVVGCSCTRRRRRRAWRCATRRRGATSWRASSARCRACATCSCSWRTSSPHRKKWGSSFASRRAASWCCSCSC
ncbi:syntaxin-11-like isoform X4 [Maniola hyperantus]|uniref:syntaxin-11-like isoform X4 n=1 Tax=Aphantopus hyperantus TaxID=2795564 RepID=UPI00374845A6